MSDDEEISALKMRWRMLKSFRRELEERTPTDLKSLYEGREREIKRILNFLSDEDITDDDTEEEEIRNFHSCKWCGREFASHHGLNGHQPHCPSRPGEDDNDENGEKELKCPECDEEFSTERGKKIHYTKVHDEEEEDSSPENEEDDENDSNPDNDGDDDDSSSDSNPKVGYNLQNVLKGSFDILRCSVCGQRFGNKDDATEHEKEAGHTKWEGEYNNE